MSRSDGTISDDMSFLAGDGEMARRIRAFDWRRHPLGDPSGWPQSLRSALSICLHSAFPTAIYWGPELRLLYNDAWAPVPGPRHPAALGAPAREVWGDIWHVIAPQFERLARSGQGVFVENQLLPMRRFGVQEETYWNYSFTAIRGERGEIAGVFNSGNETTRDILIGRRSRLLVELGDALRAEENPEAARLVALRMVGEALGLDRAGVALIDPVDGSIEIAAEWLATGVAPFGSGLTLPRLGPLVSQSLGSGRSLRIDDVAADPRIGDGPVRATFAALGVGAFVAVPWLERGALAGAAYLHAREARAWSDIDVSMVEEILQRSRAMAERAEAIARERLMAREIDHRARNALAVAQALVRLTRADDIETFRRKVEDRVAALARAHTLLAEERWREIDLRTLLEQELAPYVTGPARPVALDGPATPLSPRVAQTVALAVHELTTNAAKHGALAAPEGELSVSWRRAGGGRLVLDWRERGLTASAEPSRGAGFGGTLLSTVVEKLLGGALLWEMRREGLVCRLELPLEPHESAQPRDPGEPAAAPSGVMIVDDEPFVAIDLEAMVGALGHPIFGVFSTVGAAQRALETGRPRFAVLDANLGGESVLPLAERLRTLGVPVIIATGYQSAPELEPFAAPGAVLTKPVAPEVLESAIVRALGPDPPAASPDRDRIPHRRL